jgi:hypothetical protein
MQGAFVKRVANHKAFSTSLRCLQKLTGIMYLGRILQLTVYRHSAFGVKLRLITWPMRNCTWMSDIISPHAFSVVNLHIILLTSIFDIQPSYTKLVNQRR